MLKLAILQSDSSHTETYIGLANGADSPFAGRARIVALWGEDAVQTRNKATHDVRAVDSIADAASIADVIMVCGRFGDTHHRVAVEALEHGKPIYIDKPLTNSMSEAVDLAQRVARKGVPVFSCSPLRFAPEITRLTCDVPGAGACRGGAVVGLAEWADFGARGCNVYFYGVHSAEILHAVFGPGIEAVRVEKGASGDVVLVRYSDRLLVTWQLLRECGEIYAVDYYGAERNLSASVAANSAYYPATLDAIVRMGETGTPPLPFSYGVEVVGLLDAVERSRGSGNWERLSPLS
jgi:hypothetical protein